MTWALETTRDNVELNNMLSVAQRSMFRKMLKLKRRPITIATDSNPSILEEWVDWQIRTLRTARDKICETSSCVVESLKQSRLSWIFHVGRFGTGPREHHLVKDLILWRNLGW